jgi:malonyl CoA-acyl carrier protein transacylase
MLIKSFLINNAEFLSREDMAEMVRLSRGMTHSQLAKAFSEMNKNSLSYVIDVEPAKIKEVLKKFAVKTDSRDTELIPTTLDLDAEDKEFLFYDELIQE